MFTMPYRRGDVVLGLFPESNLRSAKRRPGLVIQADKLNTGLARKVLNPICGSWWLLQVQPTNI